jgi:hypothetical protein
MNYTATLSRNALSLSLSLSLGCSDSTSDAVANKEDCFPSKKSTCSDQSKIFVSNILPSFQNNSGFETKLDIN